MIRWLGQVNVDISPRTVMRDLWDEHVALTRMVIVAFSNNLPSLKVTLDRLLLNQDVIGSQFARRFGDAFGHQIAKLLREHIIGATEVLRAAVSGNAQFFYQKKAAWYANGAAITNLLASTGAWPKPALTTLMHGHLDTTFTEAVAELQGNWAASLAAYDVARGHVLAMASAFSDGMAGPQKLVLV